MVYLDADFAKHKRLFSTYKNDNNRYFLITYL